jgi:hypothetical protein
MTDLITEARELCSKATPGLWQVKLHNEDYGQGYGEITNFVDMGGTLLKIGVADTAEKYIEYSTLSTFIARSRALISELCDALEKYRWILVTERLPEIRCVEVLAIDKKGVLMASVDRSADGVWFGTNRAISGDVTHWMPLPSMEGLSNDT